MVSCLSIYHFLAMDTCFVFYVVWTHHGWIFIRVHLQSLPDSCPILLCNRMAQNMHPILRRRYKLYNRITPFSVLFLRRQISYSWTVLSSCNHINHFHICLNWQTSNIKNESLHLLQIDSAPILVYLDQTHCNLRVIGCESYRVDLHYMFNTSI